MRKITEYIGAQFGNPRELAGKIILWNTRSKTLDMLAGAAAGMNVKK